MQKTIIFLGSLFFACTVHAQSADGGHMTDTTHRSGMHHNWSHRDGNDNMQGRGGWDGHRGGGGRDGRMGFRRGGEGRGFGRPHIHYSPEQRKQMMSINTDYRKKAADLFKNDNQTLGQYKAGLIALQKDRKSKLQGLLTPEQKQQIENSRQRTTENMQVMAAARMERLKIRLSLSDQQVATIKSKEADLRTQMQSLHNNDGLLPQEKMEKFKELGAKRKDIVKSVLTPDQLSKYNDMGHDRGMGHDRTFHHDEESK